MNAYKAALLGYGAKITNESSLTNTVIVNGQYECELTQGVYREINNPHETKKIDKVFFEKIKSSTII